MGRGKGRSYPPRASDNSAEDYKPTFAMAGDTDMTDADGGVALGEAAQTGSAQRLRTMGEDSDTTLATSSDHTMSMSGAPLALGPSPFHTSRSFSKTVQAHIDKEGSTNLDADRGKALGTTHEAQQWHQLPPDTMRDAEELWQPPQGIDRKATLKSAQRIRKFCDDIEAHWKCTITEAMPQHLRASTSYSLTMLLHLHRLAEFTRNDMIGAHAALDMARSSRLSLAAPESVEARIEWTDNTKSSQDRVRKYAEPRVWENTAGLMMVDVRKACRSFNEAKRSERKAAAEHAMDVTQTRSKKAEKRARNKANKAAKKHEARLQGSGRIAKSGANTRSKSRMAGTDAGNQNEGTADLESGTLETHGSRKLGKKANKTQNKKLIEAMEHLFKDDKGDDTESKRNAVDRGFALPSERFSQANIPSLGSTTHDRGEDRVALNGGEMEGLE